MDATLRLIEDASDDDLRALRGWLEEGGELNGRLTLVGRPPRPGAMGTGIDALQVVLGSGGVVTAFVSGVLAWLRSRPRTMTLEVTRDDGSSVKLAAPVVRAMSVTELTAEVRSLAHFLDGDSDAGAR